MQITHWPALPTLILALSLLIQGCAPVVKQDDQTQQMPLLREQIAALLEMGELNQAAVLVESMAQSSASPQREALLLEAGEIWGLAGDWSRTEAILQSLPAQMPNQDLVMRRRLLLAELAIHYRDLDRALDLLQPPPGPESPLMLRQRYHKNMAEIFRLSGNLLESARELVELDGLIEEPQTRQANQLLLVETLAIMTDTALALLQPDPPGILGGWMDLVRILKHQSDDPANFAPQFEAWREEYPEHPAQFELLKHFLQQQTIDQGSHIAVLLPRSGPYTKVATAVRDGMMAAWYQRPVGYRPALRFYDSSNPARIFELYQQAVSQGAQMVIGPLNKEALNLLLQSDNLVVPILALNQVDQNHFQVDNLFQFGLAPEDEAEQLAERAWLDGHTTALVLTPDSDWGKRLYQSFRDRLESLGGRVLEQQHYDANANDFSQPIRHLLNVDESNARKQGLQQILGVSMEYEPRRRADAGMIFLAARPQKGRQLRPQLNFHHAGNLPVYTTSHIYSGVADSDKDKDLGQIKFVDTPWLLEDNEQSPLSRQNLARLIPGVKGQYARLYAMGIDAFNLLPHLTQLREQPGRTLNGKTGNLFMDRLNRLHRQLAWADMEHGQARITGYAPRLEKPRVESPAALTPYETYPQNNLSHPARPSPLPAKAAETGR